jgi:phage repressor protein C with HTH and peptisase S24 domain
MAQPPAKIRRHRKPQPTDSALRKLRLARSLSLEEVAAALNTSASVVHRHEMVPNAVDWKWAMAYARHYDVDPADVMFGGERPKVPIVGYIGAGAQIVPIDDFPKGGGLDEVPCPSGLNPQRTVAAIVRGTSMEPSITDGWRVFYSRDPEQDVVGVVGKLCVVKLADGGPTMLKQVRRGATAGRFNLISTNAALLEDQALDWASPVRAMLAPE